MRTMKFSWLALSAALGGGCALSSTRGEVEERPSVGGSHAGASNAGAGSGGGTETSVGSTTSSVGAAGAPVNGMGGALIVDPSQGGVSGSTSIIGTSFSGSPGDSVSLGGTTGSSGTSSSAGAVSFAGQPNYGGSAAAGSPGAVGGTLSVGGSPSTGGNIGTGGSSTGGCLNGFWGPTCSDCAVRVWGSNGSDSSDGTSWQQALATIQMGIDAAHARVAAAGLTRCDVWVAAGTYTAATEHLMRDSAPLYGGFVGTETSREQRNWQTNTTTIIGMVASADQTQIQLDGFEIKTGVGPARGGTTVANCRFTGSGTDSAIVGYDDYGTGTTVTVTDSEFSNAAAGIECSCRINVTNSYFHNTGAAIALSRGNVTATGTTFSETGITIGLGGGTIDGCSFLGRAGIQVTEGTVGFTGSTFDLTKAALTAKCFATRCAMTFAGCTFGSLS